MPRFIRCTLPRLSSYRWLNWIFFGLLVIIFLLSHPLCLDKPPPPMIRESILYHFWTTDSSSLLALLPRLTFATSWKHRKTFSLLVLVYSDSIFIFHLPSGVVCQHSSAKSHVHQNSSETDPSAVYPSCTHPKRLTSTSTLRCRCVPRFNSSRLSIETLTLVLASLFHTLTTGDVSLVKPAACGLPRNFQGTSLVLLEPTILPQFGEIGGPPGHALSAVMRSHAGLLDKGHLGPRLWIWLCPGSSSRLEKHGKLWDFSIFPDKMWNKS